MADVDPFRLAPISGYDASIPERGERMRRREFISGLAAVAVMPATAHAQQGEKRVWRIGVLMPFSAGDPEAEARGPAFEQGLGRLGWTKGTNLLIEYRWAGGEPASIRRHATELVSLAPDVIVTAGACAGGWCWKRRVAFQS